MPDSWLVTLRVADPSAQFPHPGRTLTDVLGYLDPELSGEGERMMVRVHVLADTAFGAEWYVLRLIDASGTFGVGRVAGTPVLRL